MARYGRSRSQKSRRDSRSAKQAATDELRWKRPPLAECTRRELTVPLSATVQYVDVTTWSNSENMLVEFAVVLSRLVDGKWEEILCIDTCNHGTVHRHRDGHGDPVEIVEIDSPATIQAAHADAIDEVCDWFEREWGP